MSAEYLSDFPQTQGIRPAYQAKNKVSERKYACGALYFFAPLCYNEKAT